MLFFCLAAGIALRASRRLPEDAHVTINGYIIHIALPALVLAQIHGLRLTGDLAWPVLMPWLVFAASALVFTSLGRVIGLSRQTTGALIMTAGLGNTSFVGLPMIEAFYGPQAMATGILIDQLGTYIVLYTLGILVACYYSSGSAAPREILRRVVTFPPLIALVIALVSIPFSYAHWLSGILQRLGSTLAPLALVSVGLQLRFNEIRGNALALSLGLGFKLVLAPLLIAVLYIGVLAHRGEVTQVTVLEAAMGPQIGGAIIATEYGLDPPLINLMVSIGIALSLVTLPVWYLGLALF